MEKVLGSNCLKPDILREECLKSTQLKQNQNSQFSQLVEKICIYNQFFLNELVLWFFF